MAMGAYTYGYGYMNVPIGGWVRTHMSMGKGTYPYGYEYGYAPSPKTAWAAIAPSGRGPKQNARLLPRGEL